MEGVTSVVRKPSEKYGRFGLEDEPAGHWSGVVIPEKELRRHWSINGS